MAALDPAALAPVALNPVSLAGGVMLGVALTGLIAAALQWWWRVDPAHAFRPRLTSWGIAALAGAVAVPLVQWLWPPIADGTTDPGFQAQIAALPLWLALPLLAGVAPLFEEYLFRGVLLVRLARAWGRWRWQGWGLGHAAAALVPSVGFGLLHAQYDWRGVAVTALLGTLLATARLQGASLGAVVAVHMANNAAALLVTG